MSYKLALSSTRLLESVTSAAAQQVICGAPRRTFYRLLTSITNQPDRERIKELGPDRSCAEWLLRCGATLRWKGAESWQKDFNTLPPGGVATQSKYRIEEVEAVEAGIMDVGFDHFDGCTEIKRVRLHHLPYFEDDTLSMLVDKLKGSLEHLELTSCGDITDRGLSHLTRLGLLKKLLLRDLPEVRNKPRCHAALKDALPQCTIDYTDLTVNPK